MPDNKEGLLVPGNIDLATRPVVKNSDGSISTIKSISVNIDNAEVLIPTLDPEGNELSEAEAISRYLSTGEHLGMFSSPKAATAYAKELSELQGSGDNR